MNALVWIAGGALALWALTKKTKKAPDWVETPVWRPDETPPKSSAPTTVPTETESGQRVVIEEGGGNVEFADYINLAPFQIYWSDAFLEEVWGRANSIASRLNAREERIFKEVNAKLREVGKLTRDGEYYPLGSKYPLDIGRLAYEEQRAPYWT